MTLQVREGLEQEETVRFIAAKLYEVGKITLSEAAAMAGMKKWDFAEILVIMVCTIMSELCLKI